MAQQPLLLTLTENLAQILLSRHAMLALAESCTGGLVAQMVTSLPGSSRWFDRGFVTYSNAAKIEMLGVPTEVLEKHGAVSIAVAAAMAHGALTHSLAQISAAVTGIAGPEGGSRDKPVGTVCFAWAFMNHVQTAQHHLAGDRMAVRQQSAKIALQGLIEFTSNLNL